MWGGVFYAAYRWDEEPRLSILGYVVFSLVITLGFSVLLSAIIALTHLLLYGH